MSAQKTMSRIFDHLDEIQKRLGDTERLARKVVNDYGLLAKKPQPCPVDVACISRFWFGHEKYGEFIEMTGLTITPELDLIVALAQEVTELEVDWENLILDDVLYDYVDQFINETIESGDTPPAERVLSGIIEEYQA